MSLDDCNVCFAYAASSSHFVIGVLSTRVGSPTPLPQQVRQTQETFTEDAGPLEDTLELHLHSYIS